MTPILIDPWGHSPGKRDEDYNRQWLSFYLAGGITVFRDYVQISKMCQNEITRSVYFTSRFSMGFIYSLCSFPCRYLLL